MVGILGYKGVPKGGGGGGRGNKRFFGLLGLVEGLGGTMLSMRASSVWNKLLFFTSSFENSRAP